MRCINVLINLKNRKIIAYYDGFWEDWHENVWSLSVKEVPLHADFIQSMSPLDNVVWNLAVPQDVVWTFNELLIRILESGYFKLQNHFG